MRHGHKSQSRRFDGYKVHTGIDKESEFITGIVATSGNAHDSEAALSLIDQQPEERRPEPEEVTFDTAYGTGQVREEMAARQVKVISSVPEGHGKNGCFLARSKLMGAFYLTNLKVKGGSRMSQEYDQNMSQLVHEAWHEFITRGNVREGKVRPAILRSWSRCRNKGVNPYQKKAPFILEGRELEARRYRSKILLEVAVPFVRNLYEFVAGSGFIIAIADPEAYLLEIMGDEEVRESVQRGNFVVGANWSEEFAGTNGIGTCLESNRPLQVIGYEHYCICSHKWTCSGAPIHDPAGKIIGALDMSAKREKVHSHTLGMVVGAVYAIERQLSLLQAWEDYEIANQYKSEIVDAISEGLIAVDNNGVITHFNERAQDLLGVARMNVLGRDVREVLGEKNAALVELLVKKQFVTDCEFNVNSLTGKLKCSITVRPISRRGNRQEVEGVILVFDGVKRTYRLANKMFGAKARIAFADLLGSSQNFLESIKMAKTAAKSPCSVLILGETGTGKDMIAQAIHNESPRRQGPFVAINCGAIPRELIASELFGYVEGAFTGAKKGGNPGKFELADGGTIFLDEIGEMPLDLQIALLRVIEQKVLTRVGGRELIPVDVRIIAATNKDLPAEVEKGSFRRDLYYRLNVFIIRMAPLRERKEDIKPLALRFIQNMATRLGKKIETIDEEVWDRVMAYNWPGNVRELNNVLERMVNLAVDNRLTADLLPEEIYRFKLEKGNELQNDNVSEKKKLTNLLRLYNGNISRVAKEMGVARSTVYRKLWKYQLHV